MSKRVEQAIVQTAQDRRAQVVAGAVVATGAATLAGKVGIDRLRGGEADGGRASRAYRLEDREPIDAGIRRIATGRADTAIEQLDSARGGDFADSVHETRKDLKKLRAVLRLARDELDNDAYRTENQRYRDAARHLSAARDAAVKLETVRLLERRFGDELAQQPLGPLRKRLEGERKRSQDQNDPEHLAVARVELVAGRTRISEWSLSTTGGWEAIEPGLRRGYRRGRNRMKDTIADPSAENVHEWRKRTKDLWYHLRIVRNAWPGAIGPVADEAHRLSDLLGDHHDLAILREDAGDLKVLRRCIERRQVELLDRALDLGRRLYAEPPKQFSRRLSSYWETWRT